MHVLQRPVELTTQSGLSEKISYRNNIVRSINLIAELKISVAFIEKIIKSILDIVPKLINLSRRPKAYIEIKNQIIIVKNQRGVESDIRYPCILISFKKDVKIDVRSIKVNNESLHCMLTRDQNYLRQNPESNESHTVINNKIMPFVYANRRNLTQRACWFGIKGLEQEAFPLNVNEDMSHFIFRSPQKTRVFFPKTKLILSLNIDGLDCEYGISLINACKVIINNLAFR